MSFDLNDTEREQPRWIEYRSGRIQLRFLLKPRDPAVVDELNRRYPSEERLSRRGRVPAHPDDADSRRRWVDDYLAAHLLDWEGVLTNGAKAPITTETAGKLTENMRAFILEASGADDLRDYTTDPTTGSGAMSAPASTIQG